MAPGRAAAIPVADGGEGSVDAFLAAVGGEKIAGPLQGPLHGGRSGFYCRLPAARPVVEMAAAAAPPGWDRLHAEQTTPGVGHLILAPWRAVPKKLIVGLGGSATNDGGAGMLAALGVRFLPGTGTPYLPVGGTLDQLDQVDLSGAGAEAIRVEIIAMCDIDNLCGGPAGPARVWTPEGRGRAMTAVLDRICPTLQTWRRRPGP